MKSSHRWAGARIGRLVAILAAGWAAIGHAGVPLELSGDSRSYTYFGRAIAYANDVNGNGSPELAIGNAGASWTAVSGSVRLFDGATGAVITTMTLTTTGTLGLGYSVAAISDLDGDGKQDILAGAPYSTVEGSSGAGLVAIFSGATGNLIRTLDPPELANNLGFGSAVAAIPDRNGDGREEVLVGAPGATVNGISAAGCAYVFSGMNGDLLTTLTAPSAVLHEGFGNQVGVIGDLSGDGIEDCYVASDYPVTVNLINAKDDALI